MVASGQIDLRREQQLYPYNCLHENLPEGQGCGTEELLHALLTYDPHMRLSARAALAHEYFTNSPLPQQPDLMPTFPTLHDEMMK